MGIKSGLPAGCYRLLELCDREDPVWLGSHDLSVAKVLAARGMLELLPGCLNSFGTTEKGRSELRKRLPGDMDMRLADALRKAAESRGVPTTLSSSELAEFLPNFLTPEMVERAGEDDALLDRVFGSLRATGWGSAPRFSMGKWAL